MEHSRFFGLDIHKKFAEIAILNHNGELINRLRIDSTIKDVHCFASSLSPDDHLVIESSTNSWAFYNVLSMSGANVVVSNPMQTKAIAYAKIKTDKVDAFVLARLLHSGFLPTVWVPSSETMLLRELISHRQGLSKQRTKLKNRVHSILHRNLVSYSFSDLFGKAGRAFLEDVPLPHSEKYLLGEELLSLDFIDGRIGDIEKELAKFAYKNKQVELLMSIPGVDFVSALALVAAIGDISRFKSSAKLVSYFGLNPSVYQSGNSCFHGRISKRGRSHARFTAIQSAQHLCRSHGPLKAFYFRIRNKKNHNVAVTAVARKLVVLCWHILTKEEAFYYSPPYRTEAKLNQLRFLATGKKRMGGVPKGTPRSKYYGTGISGRKIRLEQEKSMLLQKEQEYVDFIKERLADAT